MIDKITIIITTYNSESYFKTLWDSIPFNKVDNVIVVNGGESYTNDYSLEDNKLIWIQHQERKNIAQSRNDGLKIAQEIGNEHIFLIEDDMICINNNIFDEYIRVSKATGLEYLCFSSFAWEAGPVGARTPRVTIEYDKNTLVSFYRNMCNEFTYRSLHILNDIGLYREDMVSFFDIEWVYRASKSKYSSSFWFFPDIFLSDLYIKNNPDAVSRLDPSGNRWQKLQKDYEIFMREHGIKVQDIPVQENKSFLQKLKNIKLNTWT